MCILPLPPGILRIAGVLRTLPLPAGKLHILPLPIGILRILPLPIGILSTYNTSAYRYNIYVYYLYLRANYAEYCLQLRYK